MRCAGSAAFCPHVYWRYTHGHPGQISFVWRDNAHGRYQLSFTLEHLLGQLLLAGPVAGVIPVVGGIQIQTLRPL